VPAIILLIGIVLIAQLPLDKKREMEIEASMEELHGGAEAEA